MPPMWESCLAAAFSFAASALGSSGIMSSRRKQRSIEGSHVRNRRSVSLSYIRVIVSGLHGGCPSSRLNAVFSRVHRSNDRAYRVSGKQQAIRQCCRLPTMTTPQNGDAKFLNLLYLPQSALSSESIDDVTLFCSGVGSDRQKYRMSSCRYPACAWPSPLHLTSRLWFPCSTLVTFSTRQTCMQALPCSTVGKAQMMRSRDQNRGYQRNVPYCFSQEWLSWVTGSQEWLSWVTGIS